VLIIKKICHVIKAVSQTIVLYKIETFVKKNFMNKVIFVSSTFIIKFYNNDRKYKAFLILS